MTWKQRLCSDKEDTRSQTKKRQLHVDVAELYLCILFVPINSPKSRQGYLG